MIGTPRKVCIGGWPGGKPYDAMIVFSRTKAATEELAGTLHHDDRRVREPYLNHLLRVAIRIICYYRVTDVDVKRVAYVLKPGETTPPKSIQGAFDKALTVRDVVKKAIKVGVRADEIATWARLGTTMALARRRTSRATGR